MGEAIVIDLYALRTDLELIRERATVQQLLAERDVDRRLGPSGTGRGAAPFRRRDDRTGVFFRSPGPYRGRVRAQLKTWVLW